MATPGDDAFERDLGRNAANHVALTPLGFLERTARIFPDRTSVVHGRRRYTWRQTSERCHRLAGALMARGIGRGDTVAVMAPNIPEMFEAHFGVPMAGAVLNALNVRLDAATIAFILRHGEAKVLLTDTEFSAVVGEALKQLEMPPLVIDIADPEFAGEGQRLGALDYEALLAEGDPATVPRLPDDEWQAIALNYTSGTTGDPKGVVYHHRGAFLTAVGNSLVWDMGHHPVYLWTLPMFHCNGWCFPWTITERAGTHVCLRRVEAGAIFAAIAEHGVDHFCGAPIVLSMLVNAPPEQRREFSHTVKVMTAAAPPPPSTLEAVEAAGFRVTHVYGLTECYGPSVVSEWNGEWDSLDAEERAAKKSRQGVRYPVLDELAVMDPQTMQPVPADGETLGEVFMRGNVVMKGYFKNPAATEEAFRGGWFHTGDLGVLHADGYIALKDRSKDIIISGGENISSVEVEQVLYRHPSVLDVAVVARPDERWGETPCAFVELKLGASEPAAEELIAFCRERIAHYKAPRRIVFGPLPKTSTGKIQKFALRDRARSL